MSTYLAGRDSNGNSPRQDGADTAMADDLNGIDLKDIIADFEKEAVHGFSALTPCSGSGNKAVAQASAAVMGAGESTSGRSNQEMVPVIMSEPENETMPLASGKWSETEEAIAARETEKSSIAAIKRNLRIYEYSILESQCQVTSTINDTGYFCLDAAQKLYEKIMETLRSMKKPRDVSMEVAEIAFLEAIQKQETPTEELIRGLQNAKNASLTLTSLIPESQRALKILKRGESGTRFQRIVETSEGSLRYECILCTKSYSRPSDLSRHIKVVHKNKTIGQPTMLY